VTTTTTGTRRAIGLMSGTSMDGIDAAVIETDGERVSWCGPARTFPYDAELRRRLEAAIRAPDHQPGELAALERDLTDAHADAVEALLHELLADRRPVDLVGLHGHTLVHRPKEGLTHQLGDGHRLAGRLGIDVAFDVRSADVAAGGEGAPFASAYHRALAKDLAKPVAVLNLGGVGNVTWIGPGSAASVGDDALSAFDTGPGNGLLDDWVRRHTSKGYDEGGRLAASGTVDENRLDRLLAHPYFERRPPKSLDRLDFTLDAVEGLSLADGAATLAAFTTRSVARAREHLAAPPRRWLVTGGGRHNATIMAMLAELLAVPVEPIEAIGADGDALEAQAFAFLAVRSVRRLPLSFPGTTGVPAPTCGGRLARAETAGR
jgi:anhydro-N-acetylmuramic acid kinase